MTVQNYVAFQVFSMGKTWTESKAQLDTLQAEREWSWKTIYLGKIYHSLSAIFILKKNEHRNFPSQCIWFRNEKENNYLEIAV